MPKAAPKDAGISKKRKAPSQTTPTPKKPRKTPPKPKKTPQPFRFLDLPAELRLCVYDELFASSSLKECSGLYLANSQTHDEIFHHLFITIRKQLLALNTSQDDHVEETTYQFYDPRGTADAYLPDGPDCNTLIDFTMPQNYEECLDMTFTLRVHFNEAEDAGLNWQHLNDTIRKALAKICRLQIEHGAITIYIEDSSPLPIPEDASEEDVRDIEARNEKFQGNVQESLCREVSLRVDDEFRGTLIYADRITTLAPKPKPPVFRRCGYRHRTQGWEEKKEDGKIIWVRDEQRVGKEPQCMFDAVGNRVDGNGKKIVVVEKKVDGWRKSGRLRGR